MLLKQVDVVNLGQTSQEIKTHINTCDGCKEFLETMRQVDNLIKLKKKELPSEEYWRSYWSRLRARNRRMAVPQEEKLLGGSLFPRLRFAFEILAILLVAISAFLVANNQRDIKTLAQSMQALQRERVAAARPVPEKNIVGTPEKKIKNGQPKLYAANFRNDIRLFNEVGSLFPSDMGWVATDNGQVELGLLNADSARSGNIISEGTRPLLFLNFTVFLKNSSVGTQKISSPKIVTLDGNKISIKTNDLFHSGRVLKYQFSPVLVNKKTVQTTLRLSISEPKSPGKEQEETELRTVITLRDGESVELGKISSSEGDYSVFLSLYIDGNRKVETTEKAMI
jgi:hypothetical protein